MQRLPATYRTGCGAALSWRLTMMPSKERMHCTRASGAVPMALFTDLEMKIPESEVVEDSSGAIRVPRHGHIHGAGKDLHGQVSGRAARPSSQEASRSFGLVARLKLR